MRASFVFILIFMFLYVRVLNNIYVLNGNKYD